MNWLDVVIIVSIAVATVSGLGIGIIKAALSLAGLIIGVILAGQYYMPLAGQLSITQAGLAQVVAFAIILVVVMVTASVLAFLLKKVAAAIMLGWLNRLGGAALGLVVGSVFCGAILAIWVKYLGVGGAISGSMLAPVLLDKFPMVLVLLPAEFDSIRAFFQ